MSQSVTFNLVLQVTISIGEPKVVINSDTNHTIRQCARCAAGYHETSSVLPQYPMCPLCVEELQAQRDYEQEIEQNRLEKERARISETNWKMEGF